MTEGFLEPRNCFKQEAHMPHEWHDKFWCTGDEPRKTDAFEPTIGTDTRQTMSCDKAGPHAPHEHTWKDEVFICLGSPIGATPSIEGEGMSFGEALAHHDKLNTGVDLEATADALLANRKEVYGDRIEYMENVAKMWSGFLNFTIEPWQIPIMEMLHKTYRVGRTPDYGDNVDDVDGWMVMFREYIEHRGGMIDARTVTEYLNIKHNGEREHVVEVRIPARETYAEELIPQELANEVQARYGRQTPPEFTTNMPLSDKDPAIQYVQSVLDQLNGIEGKPSGNPYANVQDSED
jgi:hypothetical protein